MEHYTNSVHWMKPRNKGIRGIIFNPRLLSSFLLLLLLNKVIFYSQYAYAVSKEWEVVHFQGLKLSIKRDSLTGVPRIIKGLNFNIHQYNIHQYTKKTEVLPEDINRAARRFIGDLAPILKIDPNELEIKAINKVNGEWFISYWQIYRGVLIYDSSIGFSIERDGKIHSLGAIIYPNIELDVRPKISQGEAFKIAFEHLRKKGFKLIASRLVIYPKREERRIVYNLVYALNLFPVGSNKKPFLEGGGYAYFVDARNGQILCHEEILSILGCCVPYEEK